MFSINSRPFLEPVYLDDEWILATYIRRIVNVTDFQEIFLAKFSENNIGKFHKQKIFRKTSNGYQFFHRRSSVSIIFIKELTVEIWRSHPAYFFKLSLPFSKIILNLTSKFRVYIFLKVFYRFSLHKWPFTSNTAILQISR